MLVEKSEGVGFHTFSAMTLEKEHTVIDESGFLTIFLAELTFDDTTRRYLLPIYLNRNATRYSTDEANRTVRLLIDKGESLPLEGGAFPEWAELDNPVAELEALLERAKAIARDELGNLSDRLQSAEEIRIAPRREEMRYRFRRRLQDNQDRTDAWSIWLDAGRILLVDGEDIVGEWMDENRDMPKEEKQIVIKKKITNLKAYRQKLENDFANEEARVERIPEVTLVHKEAGGVWVEVI
jgi:hypothetical protein